MPVNFHAFAPHLFHYLYGSLAAGIGRTKWAEGSDITLNALCRVVRLSKR